MNDEKLYDQLAHMWQHYASWREKIFAGYLTALAALGVVFSQHQSRPARATVFAAAILISIVFVILDLRNEQFINVCQDAAAALEGKDGGFTTLNLLRDSISSRASLGTAARLLAGGVISASLGGLFVYFIKSSLGGLDKTEALGGLVIVVAACFVPRFFAWLNKRTPRTSPHGAAMLLSGAAPQKK